MLTTIFSGRALVARIGVIVFLIVSFGSAAIPAKAEPPHANLTFDPIEVTYALGNFTSVAGYWRSEGLLEGEGDAQQVAHHTGQPVNGGFFKMSHFMTVLSDDRGTITIRDQTTQLDWAGLDATGSGQWVIQGATGDYSGLHGQGKSTLEAIYHDECPTVGVDTNCIVITMVLTGANGQTNN